MNPKGIVAEVRAVLPWVLVGPMGSQPPRGADVPQGALILIPSLWEVRARRRLIRAAAKGENYPQGGTPGGAWGVLFLNFGEILV